MYQASTAGTILKCAETRGCQRMKSNSARRPIKRMYDQIRLRNIRGKCDWDSFTEQRVCMQQITNIAERSEIDFRYVFVKFNNSARYRIRGWS